MDEQDEVDGGGLKWALDGGLDHAWFAVDRDGHVGFFTSAGTGPVPAHVLEPDADGDALYDYLREMQPITEPVLDPPALYSGRPHHEELRSGSHVVFVDSSDDQVRRDVAADRAKVVPAREGVAVWYPAMAPATYAALHAVFRRKAVCTSCYAFETVRECGEYAERGLYGYDWLGSVYGPGPYVRLAAPRIPIRTLDLPDVFRATVERARFPSVCFAEAVRLGEAPDDLFEAWRRLRPEFSSPFSAWLDDRGSPSTGNISTPLLRRVRKLIGR